MTLCDPESQDCHQDCHIYGLMSWKQFKTVGWCSWGIYGK